MVNQQGPAADVDGLAVHAAHNARAVFIGKVLHLGQGVLVFADDLVEHPGEGAAHLLHQGGGGHDCLFRQGPAAKGLNAAQHHGAPGEQLAGVHQHGVDVAHLLHALIAHHHGAGPATQAQLAAAKALMAVGTLLVISKVAMHSSSEAMSPMGAISWEADSEGSGL